MELEAHSGFRKPKIDQEKERKKKRWPGNQEGCRAGLRIQIKERAKLELRGSPGWVAPTPSAGQAKGYCSVYRTAFRGLFFYFVPEASRGLGGSREVM